MMAKASKWKTGMENAKAYTINIYKQQNHTHTHTYKNQQTTIKYGYERLDKGNVSLLL